MFLNKTFPTAELKQFIKVNYEYIKLIDTKLCYQKIKS